MRGWKYWNEWHNPDLKEPQSLSEVFRAWTGHLWDPFYPDPQCPLCLALLTHICVCNLQALQHVNARLRELYPDEQDLLDTVLMTNNHAQVGVRLINSVNHYGK